jgi:hypothetical protein
MYCVIFVSRSRLQYSQRGGYPSTLASWPTLIYCASFCKYPLE